MVTLCIKLKTYLSIFSYYEPEITTNEEAMNYDPNFHQGMEFQCEALYYKDKYIQGVPPDSANLNYLLIGREQLIFYSLFYNSWPTQEYENITPNIFCNYQ